MPREFELSTEVTVPATPEEVWAAISTGPGIDCWYMGRTDVDPGVGGTIRTDMGGHVMTTTITAWEPGHRVAHQTEVEPDGTFYAFENVIEGRGQGSTVIRGAISGFLGGEDWQDEYDALSQDGPIYPFTLGAYVTHFAGRTSEPVTGYRAGVGDRSQYWRELLAGLGLPDDVEVGVSAHVAAAGLAPFDGVVDYVSPSQLGVRGPDELLRFVHGMGGVVVIGHHLFAPDVDQPGAERAWQQWLDLTFAPPA